MKERGKSLEAEFFARQDAKLKQKLKVRLEREQARKDLATAYPNLSAELVERFLDDGMDVEAVAALGLIPLVMVAWADGAVSEKERAAILSAAEQRGLGAGTRSHALLSDWLGQRPSAQAIEHWQHFVTTAFRDLSPEEREQLRNGVLRLAEDVARATGGFLGLGSKISTEEQAVLDRIAQAFA
jgi:uncharacterized tellurite resistance protein B-like protein